MTVNHTSKARSTTQVIRKTVLKSYMVHACHLYIVFFATLVFKRVAIPVDFRLARMRSQPLGARE